MYCVRGREIKTACYDQAHSVCACKTGSDVLGMAEERVATDIQRSDNSAGLAMMRTVFTDLLIRLQVAWIFSVWGYG